MKTDSYNNAKYLQGGLHKFAFYTNIWMIHPVKLTTGCCIAECKKLLGSEINWNTQYSKVKQTKTNQSKLYQTKVNYRVSHSNLSIHTNMNG